MSTLLAVGTGALTNLVTSGWSWPLGIGFAVLGSGWVAFEIRQRSHEQREAAVEGRRQVLADLVPPELPDQAGGVFDLLVAARRVMPFQGRRAEQDQLHRWCEDSSAHPMMILSGPAGVGKTRLGLEFGLSLTDPWVAGRLAPGQGGNAVARIVACGDPALLLVDNADTRSDLPALLESLAGLAGKVRVRALLVTRDAAGLQAVLGTSLSDEARWLADCPTLPLQPQGDVHDQQRWYAKAVSHFARALHVLSPTGTELAGQVGTVGEPMLVVLARALLTVLDTRVPRRVGWIRRVPTQQVAAGLVDHEVAWWEATARLPMWGIEAFSSEVLQRCVLAMALRGAADADGAVRALQRLPELADANQMQLRNAARWVLHLYPAEPGGSVEIRPNLLGDWFVVDRLTRQPDLARTLAVDLDDAELQRVITLLTRAAGTLPAALDLLDAVWRAGEVGTVLLVTARAAIVAAHTALLDQRLAAFIGDNTVSAAALAALEELIPEYLLPRTRLAVIQRQADLRRAGGAPAPLAQTLINLCVRLWVVGRYHDAHTAVAEAVRIYRGVVVEHPAHRPELAKALDNLGVMLWTTDRPRDAQAAGAEAVDLYRKLATDNPTHQPDLAKALDNLSTTLSALGRHHDAHTTATEAVNLYRDLAGDNPTHQPAFAKALDNLGTTLSALGRHHDAHTTAADAVNLYRDLLADNPAHQPDLAKALDNLGTTLSVLGRHHDAHTTTAEAVNLYRDLATDNPAHRPDLAKALNNLGTMLWALGRHQDAHATATDAVNLYRDLAGDNPTHQPAFAKALDNLGATLSALGRHQDAHTTTTEAVSLYRNLVIDNPSLRSDLAKALDNLGVMLWALGRHQDGHSTATDAVNLYRDLATDNPSLRAHLAKALNNLAAMLCVLGEHDDEFEVRSDELHVRKALMEADPELNAEKYQQARAQTQAEYARHGREEEAVKLGLSPC